jgi:hypothetical protein
MLLASAGVLVIVSASAVATAASRDSVETATSVESSAVGAAEVATVESSVADTADTPASAAGHPLVGVWLVTDPADPEFRSVGAFSADGIYQQVDVGGPVSLGAWESTGPSSAALTFVQLEEDGGAATIRGTIEVNPDGQGFTAEATLEFTGSEGAPTGEYGPGTVTGTRITVEPMGTPVGTLDELFAEFEEGTDQPAPPTTS